MLVIRLDTPFDSESFVIPFKLSPNYKVGFTQAEV